MIGRFVRTLADGLGLFAGAGSAQEDYDQAAVYHKKGNYKEAIKWYKKAAEQG
jgi:TPR repeat protein